MRVGRLEALDLFRKWRDDGSFVRCQGSFFKFAFSNEGQISSVTDREVRLSSKDLRQEIVLTVTDEVIFQYLDNRNVTGIEKQYEHCLIAYITPVTAENDGETIAFGVIQA